MTQTAAVETVKTYEIRRQVKVAGEKRYEGLLPEALTWRYLEAVVHGGFLVEVEVSLEDLRAAISEQCPHLATLIGHTMKPPVDLSDLQVDLVPEVGEHGYTRAELEKLEWNDLRALAKADDRLKGNSSRVDIINMLAEDE